MSETWHLLVKFGDSSHSFANGFEAGMVFERLKPDHEPFELSVHQANRQQFIDMVKALDWSVYFEDVFSESIPEKDMKAIRKEWVKAKFSPCKVIPFRVVQGGLSKGDKR